MDTVIKNNQYKVNIESYNSDAMGVCHVDGRAVFVPNTIVGENWEIKVLKVGSSAVYAKGINIIDSSGMRIEPDCPHFGKCGGCDTRHMDYAEELNFKLNKVNSALRHIGKQNICVDEIIGSEEICRYRNKCIFAVASVGDKAEFGFYRERSHDLIPINNCLLQTELSCRAAAYVVEFMNSNGIPAYDEQSGKGAVRHIFCRQAYHCDDAVLCIVSAKGFGTLTEKLVSYLRDNLPELTGIVLNINKNRGNTVLSGDFYTLWGKAEIIDTLCGNHFEIAPQAFYQINPTQAEKLYMKALEYAELKGNELVFDLYCGAGTISLALARNAKKVIGAEIVPEAIENANENAQRNNINNVEFICADAGLAAKELASRALKPEVIVVDPPRKGMNEDAITAVASMRPDKIVYVSCNCATQARDILRFNSLGYKLSKISAVDMFPRTSHVETVCLLSRKDK